MPSVTLACLLPARNCAADLVGYFESVARFADAVVALDDGSTDDTAELLAAQPLVRVVLRNPRRASYAGWDDAANRNRLLTAAADLRPPFIISIDADPDSARRWTNRGAAPAPFPEIPRSRSRLYLPEELRESDCAAAGCETMATASSEPARGLP